MAEFKVGDRVRIVRTVNDAFPEMVGKVGMISLMDRTATPYRVNIDGLPDSRMWCHEVAHLDASAPPPERPIEVGDYVRWERRCNPEMWIEGELLEIDSSRKSLFIDAKDDCGKWPVTMRGRTRCDGPHWESVILRRIPRPAEAQATVPPTPVLVDGLTPAQCLAAFENLQRTDGRTRKLTTSQLAVARGLHTVSLRSKVTASRDAERNRVLVDLQDEP